MFISFILPVLNVENYLHQCINSILDIENSEILLVIGNSSDNSNNICYDFEKKYENIRVIKRDGSGLSNARNCGFAKSCGDYILYIDSDDYIHTENLVSTLNKLKNQPEIEVLASNFYGDYGSSIVSCTQIAENTDFYTYDYTKKFLKSTGFYFNVWRYIFKKDYLISNNLLFIEGKICEDVPYTAKAFSLSNKIYYNSLPFYYYRYRREGSLMNVISQKRLEDTAQMFDISINILKNSKTLSNKKLFINKILLSYFFTLSEIYSNYKLNQSAYIFFKNNLKLFKNTISFTLVYYFIKIFGLKNVSLALFKIKQYKNR